MTTYASISHLSSISNKNCVQNAWQNVRCQCQKQVVHAIAHSNAVLLCYDLIVGSLCLIFKQAQNDLLSSYKDSCSLYKSGLGKKDFSLLGMNLKNSFFYQHVGLLLNRLHSWSVSFLTCWAINLEYFSSYKGLFTRTSSTPFVRPICLSRFDPCLLIWAYGKRWLYKTSAPSLEKLVHACAKALLRNALSSYF